MSPAPDDASSIRLSREPDFLLGALAVRPALRRVEHAGGCQLLEPRVMQVLVLLARRRGAVVSRDELIQACWAGRVVGDNAINRVVSRLRQLAVTVGPGAFSVETVPRVGYRLLALPAGVAPDEVPAAFEPLPAEAAVASTVRPRRWVTGAALAVVAATATGGGWWAAWRRASRHDEVAALLEQADFARRQEVWPSKLTAVELARSAAALDPASPAAWGRLAVSLSDLASGMEGADLDVVLVDAAAAAQRALALDGGNADAAAARLRLRPVVGRWGELEAACREALRRAPDHPDLLAMMIQLLCDVARPAGAIEFADRLVGRHPLRPGARAMLVLALWLAGRTTEADAASHTAITLWPGHASLWDMRFRLLALGGRPSTALEFAARVGDQAAAGSPMPYDLALVLGRALATRGAADVGTALSELVAARRQGRVASSAAAQFAAALGDVDFAFDLSRRLFFGATGGGAVQRRRVSTAFLFAPPMRPLRNDARFAALTGALGLDDYWRTAAAEPGLRPRRG